MGDVSTTDNSCYGLSFAAPLFRGNPNRSQPPLYHLGPFRNRKLRFPQPKCMTALGAQMHLHRNVSLFQRRKVGKRVLYRISRVILRVQQKRRRCVCE